jgi:hypothetical protein
MESTFVTAPPTTQSIVVYDDALASGWKVYKINQ